MSNIFANLQSESKRQRQLVQQKPIEKSTTKSEETSSTPTPTREVTQTIKSSRDRLREKSRDNQRHYTPDLPTRDEIQEFSFRLRDELRVKVQAEVPHQWQGELETIAQELNIKKLELYRYIIGEFLGKVTRNSKLPRN